MSKKAFLMAGTKFYFDASADHQTPDWQEVAGIESFGALGETTESKENTTISDEAKTYGAAMQDSAEAAINGQFYSTDANQKTFRDKAKAKELVYIKVELKDGTTAEMQYQLLGFQIVEGTGEDWVKFSIPYRKSGVTTWTEASA